MLEIGGNRAIDLIVAKESGAAGGGRRSDPGRPLGEDPASGQSVVVKAGRYGPYVTDGDVNATLPREMAPDAVTLDEAVGLLNARRASGGGKSKRRAPGRAAKGGQERRGGGEESGIGQEGRGDKKARRQESPGAQKRCRIGFRSRDLA